MATETVASHFESSSVIQPFGSARVSGFEANEELYDGDADILLGEPRSRRMGGSASFIYPLVQTDHRRAVISRQAQLCNFRAA